MSGPGEFPRVESNYVLAPRRLLYIYIYNISSTTFPKWSSIAFFEFRVVQTAPLKAPFPVGLDYILRVGVGYCPPGKTQTTIKIVLFEHQSWEREREKQKIQRKMFLSLSLSINRIFTSFREQSLFMKQACGDIRELYCFCFSWW